MSNQCPLLTQSKMRIGLGHGGGGSLSQELLRKIIVIELAETLLTQESDSTPFLLEKDHGDLAEEFVMTTDSFVVDPLFFSGGDIGKLSIVGTVNDIAVMGCVPKALSLSLILEEGLLIADLKRILRSIRDELRKLNLKITCGDTKVVPKGKGDKIYINTSAIGLRKAPQLWHPNKICVGDRLIVSREIGCHGLAILNERNNLGLTTQIESDCHELLTLTLALLKEEVKIHCARDLTRGGLVSALVELAETSNKKIEVDEVLIPMGAPVQSACELLGLDPYMIANEGTALYFLPENQVDAAINIMKRFSYSEKAKVIGCVSDNIINGKVLLNLSTGIKRQLRSPPGELLPRIC